MAGRLEGVHFHRDKWVWFLIAGTMLGAVSSLYDKYLLARAHFTVPTVQAWFSIYLVVLFTPFAIGWKRRWWKRSEFRWRWTIAAVGLFLLLADALYFHALAMPGALVSVISTLRLSSFSAISFLLESSDRYCPERARRALETVRSRNWRPAGSVTINADAHPEFRLVNLIMQRRARWLLSKKDDLFLQPAKPARK